MLQLLRGQGHFLKRDFASAAARYAYQKNATPPPSKKPSSASSSKDRQGPLRNEEISSVYRTVRLVDKAGQMGPPTSTRDLIATMKTWEDKHFLELVSEKPEPLVKYVSVREEYHKMKETRVKQQASKIEQKEVQMTWNVDSADLEHKVKRVRDGLAKGQRFDIVIAPKARQPVPPPDVMEARMQEIVDLIGDIGEEREVRKLERRVAIIRVQQAKTKTKS